MASREPGCGTPAHGARVHEGFGSGGSIPSDPRARASAPPRVRARSALAPRRLRECARDPRSRRALFERSTSSLDQSAPPTGRRVVIIR
eukprot:31499-Pelagococcus_subviridis.AAC.2